MKLNNQINILISFCVSDISSRNNFVINWKFVAILSLAVATTTFLSPQIGFFGRGLRTTIPALLVACFAIVKVSPRAFLRSFHRFRVVFLLGLIFVTQAGLRFMYADDPTDLLHTFVIGPLIALCLLLWIGALAELGHENILKFRYWILIIWCVSLFVGIPHLINFPGVARLTMGNINASENASLWARYGVGEYSTYTAFSICISLLFVTSNSIKNKMAAFLTIFIVSLAGIAVLFSTFTMASSILIVSIVTCLFLWKNDIDNITSRFRKLSLIILTSVLLSIFYNQASKYEQLRFVFEKIERLYSGISTTGLASGDETGRGEWFVSEMSSFVDEPFLGYIPGVIGQTGNGHSSLSNTLVLFGIFCASIWFFTLLIIFINCYKNTVDSNNRILLCVCWMCFFAGGILNPIWHSPSVLGALFAYSLAPRKDRYC